jgi:hypothetical protein
MPRAYDQGWMRINWAGHLLTNWCGDAGFVRYLGATLPALNMAGDLSTFHGKVMGKRHEDGEHLVDIDVWAVNQNGVKNTVGNAVVRLPSRSPDDKYLFRAKYQG